MNLFEIRQRISVGESIYDLPLRVTFYARVSTDKDVQLNSLDNQIFYFKDLIQNNKNWTYVDGYIDEGISGTSVKKRESFLQMIDDAKKGKFDLILTKEISRFSRSTLDSIKYTQELLYNNVGVIFQSDNINTIMPDSELRLTIMSSIAQEEVRKLSERVKFGFKRSVEKGKVLGNSVIIGYDKENGKMTINEDQAEVIRIIFNMYSTGNYGLKAISTYLYDHGYKNKKGGYYPNSTIKNIIRNPKYKGYYRANMFKIVDYKTKKRIRLEKKDWVVKKDDVGNVPAIVTEELWNKANDVLDKKSSGFCAKVKNSNVFKVKTTYGGKLYCAEHNMVFRRHSDSRSHRHIWICDLLHRNGVKACKSAILYEEELDIIFKKIIDSILSERKDIIEHLYKLYIDNCNSKDYGQEKQKIEKKNKEVIAKKNKIMDLLINETISKEDYQRRIKELDEELDSNNKKLDDLVVQQKTEELMKRKYKDLQKKIKDNMNTEKSFPELFRLLVDRVVVNKIDGDRHNVKLDIYVNILSEKISVCNKTFLKDNLHPLCSHEENNYIKRSPRRKSNRFI